MSNTCPVCRNMVDEGATKCENCGFTDKQGINKELLIYEDANNWLETVVKPYRIQWEAKKRETDSKKNYCRNCGKELQEEWLRCPYCTTTVADKNQVISSAISSGSGGWGYGIEQIKLETSTPTYYTINKTDSASETKLNELFTPTEKSGYKKMCNFIGTAIWVILGVFLLIQILGGGIDPSISFNTMVCCVVFYIIFYFMGKYTLKNKCKKCQYSDGANNCTRMNMNVDEAIQFDCLCR